MLVQFWPNTGSFAEVRLQLLTILRLTSATRTKIPKKSPGWTVVLVSQDVRFGDYE